MKLSLLLTAVISIASIGLVPLKSVRATSFNEQEVDQNQFAVIAAPYRHGYNLVLVEQISGKQKCWAETGSSPVQIEPLFLNFDFTHACKRSSDSNNYSIRVDGQDYGMDYLVEIVEQDGELHLIGIPRDRHQPKLHIGRTHGLSSGSLKIVLDPQWRLTKRTYGKDVTDHIYLSHTSQQPSNLISNAVTPKVTNSSAKFSNTDRSSSIIHSETQPTNSAKGQPVRQPIPQATSNYPTNVYQQQPVYLIQPVPQAQTGNMYQQPVYLLQPVDNKNSQH